MTITAERLREVLCYDPASGEFCWRVAAGRVRVGEIAGTVMARGYRAITVDKSKYLAHRLAYLYMNGKFPDLDLDHIDRDKLNNRLANLREASASQNQGNTPRPRHNTSGYKGVYWNRREAKWHARIHVGCRNVHLGYFDNPIDAQGAYMAAASDHFGEFASAA